MFTTDRHWRVERRAYRIVGVNPDQEQPWTVYAASVGAFSVLSFLLLFLVILAQGWLPFNHGESMHVDTALNTAVSFVTNTNWQSYAGEAGTSVFVQAVGLTVQNFASAAVGIAVVAALIRAIARHESRYIGNFWVDLTRVVVRVLLPIAAVAAVVLVLGGVIQNLAAPTDVTGVTGAAQSIPGGLVASQEAIKELGTNGGGFFNANSAHPFENPNALTNLFEIFLLLVIPFALPRAYGIMVGDRRQGHAILAFMTVLWGASVALTTWAEVASGDHGGQGDPVRDLVLHAVRRVDDSTSTGAVNSLHESYSPLGGGVVLLNMMLGEISPGGTGSGLYGALVVAIIAVFIAGLMVGPDAGVPRQDDRPARDHPQRALHADHAGPGPRPRRAGHRPAGQPGRPARERPARSHRDGLRVHLRRQQQRQRVRRAQRRPAVPQPDPRPGDGARPVRPDGPRAGPGRPPRRPEAATGHRGDHADAYPAVRHPPGQRGAHRHRPDLLPHPRSRTPRGGTVMNPRSLTAALPQAFTKLDPRHVVRSPVIFVVWVGSLLTTVLAVVNPSVFAVGVAVWLWVTVVFANLAEAVAEGRGKAQAATLRAARTETMARRLVGVTRPVRARSRSPAPTCGSATSSSSRPAR